MASSCLPWRVGRKVGRTIYQQVGSEPSDDDVLIGVMDTPEQAAEAVHGRNALARGQTDWRGFVPLRITAEDNTTGDAP